MERNFSVILSRLRKEKNMSQKEAAAGLGVSQALLSHYENGIRECGLDFIIKAADFYNVTTDYLLGRSDSKQGFTGAFTIKSDIGSDNVMGTLTLFRSAGRLREYLIAKHDGELVDEIHHIYGMLIYRMIISEVDKGTFPKSWLPNVDSVNNDTYTKIMDGLEYQLILGTRTVSPEGAQEPPQCIKTVVKHMQQYIKDQCAEQGITLSEDCVCSYK
ncbi:MAG: helix-turn-helix domain-containing protein [Acutalibacteraceae bacterium]